MSNDDSKRFLLIEGIDTSVSVRELITVFQQASSIRFTVKRNMDPENLRAILEFETDDKFDQLHRKLEEERIKLKGKRVNNLRSKKEDGHFGYCYDQFLEYINWKQKGNKIPKAPSVPDPNIKTEKDDGTEPPIVAPVLPGANSINNLIAAGRRQSDMAAGAIDGQMKTLPNGNFQTNDIRRVCRHCNVECPNLNQYESHRKGKKHVKNEAYFRQHNKYKPEILALVASGRALWMQQSSPSVDPVGALGTNIKVESRKTDMQKSMEIVMMNRQPARWCPICAIDLSSPVVALTHYRGKKHLTKLERAKQDGTLPDDVLERLQTAIGFMEGVEKGHFLGKKRAHEEQDPSGPAPVPPPKITRDYNNAFKNRRADAQTRKQNDYKEFYQNAYSQRDKQQRKKQLPPRQNRYIVEEGLQKQREIYSKAGVSREFDEPVPVETGEIQGEIIEEDCEEEVVGGSFHEKLDSLYQKNPNQD